MWRRLISLCQVVKVQVQRLNDHVRRGITGLPRKKRSMVTPQVYLGGQYGFRKIEEFRKMGITAVVNMRTTPVRDMEILQDLRYLHLPTPDFTAPSLEHLKMGVTFMHEEIGRGGVVYVHCHWGEGRGPSMVLAYLMYARMTYEDAFGLVKRVRPFIKPNKEQVERLREFEKLVEEEKM